MSAAVERVRGARDAGAEAKQKTERRHNEVSWKLPVPAYRDVEEQQQGTVFEHLTRGVVNRELHNSSLNTRLYDPDIDGS